MFLYTVTKNSYLYSIIYLYVDTLIMERQNEEVRSCGDGDNPSGYRRLATIEEQKQKVMQNVKQEHDFP